jgi:ankyrin repeat protein
MGADDSYGNTPLLIAATTSLFSTELEPQLISSGANLEARRIDGLVLN